MATSNKFDLPSNSPEGSSYANGSRAYYAVSSLDRSGSLREATENRTLPSQPNVSRSGSTLSHGDVLHLIQSFPFDLKQMAADQKSPRQGEIKRMITSALGISQDDALFGSVNVKSLPSSSQGEIRRVKAILSDGSNKASSRSKAFGEAALVVDKARQSSFLRKRSRSDVSFSERLNVAGQGERSVPGGSTPKMGSESHLTLSGFEVVPQQPDERGKSAVPSKRVRTSMVDVRMDVRASTLGRPIASQDKDKDMFRLVSGCNAIQPEEKGRTLATGTVEGWEKSKMRKKRSGIKSDISGSSASSKPPLDGERDFKWGIQQKPENDGRPRLSTSQGFRSALANGSAGVGKSEGTSQQSGLSNRSTPRNDQDTGSPLVERRDRGGGLEKERTSLKAGSRASPREENSAASPAPVLMTKMSASVRAPRSSSGSLSKLSPNIQRQIETPEEFENSQSVNKLHSVNGINRKRMASVRSPSPPVTHWVGQRPQKITRVARRTNFVPLVASHDEAPSVETSIASGPGTNTGLGIGRRSAANSPQQVKLKIDHISCTGLSESEESGAAENKGKDKVSKKPCDGDDKSGTSVHKIATQVLPSRKNKIGLDGDLGGGIRRQGRSGRGFASLRSTLTCGTEKPENGVTSKQMRSARLGSEKNESKAGRPPNKKLAERKAYMRQRVGTNSGSSDFAGESDDDHEELLAAANASLSTSNACSSTFWKQAEPAFRFVSEEDVAFLKQQILLAEGSLSNIHGPSYGDPRSKGDVGSSLVPAIQTHINEEACVSSINAMGLEDERNIGAHDMIPLSMRMLAATIDIDEIEELCCSNHQYDNDYKLDEGFHSKENVTLENSLTVGSTASNGYRLNASRRYCDELGLDNLSQDLIADAYVGGSPHYGSKESGPRVYCTVNEGVNYASMTLDEKILLELQSIGIFPELLPDLAPGEGDGISETITKLEGELSEQAIKSKKALLKLENAVTEAKEVQERKFEQLAMDKLIGMAYEKYMAYWGPSASGGKSTGNKLAKRAALSFVRRVLSRCHKYENTGRSCFSEPSFKGLLASSQQKTLKINGVGEVGPANSSIENAACPSEKKDSSGHISGLNFQCSQKMDGHDKYNLAAVSHSHLPEGASVKEDISTNRLKRRELLLDDVGASISLQGPSGLAGSLSGGVKGKRSERERDGKGHGREVLAKNGATKVGRPALGSAKGERKTKSKPKQRTAQLSASVNSLLGQAPGQASGPPKATSSQAPRPSERPGNVNRKEGRESASRSAVNKSGAIDLSHLQLPEMDVLGGSDDLGDHGQDLGSWLNIEDDGLVDNDCMGLGIPMDDLSDLNMMV